MNSEPKPKPITKQFVYNLFKTYEAAYDNIPNTKKMSIQKVQKVTKLSRGTVYKILKEIREQEEEVPHSSGKSRKWATGLNDASVEAIKSRILSLSASNNDHVSVRKIHAELKADNLFHGGKATLHTLLRQMGFFYRNYGDGWKLILRKKGPINEQLSLNQSEFDNFSISNMMEVKHSPVAQMEFRSTKNGLPDEEEEDLDTLFDDGDGKSLTPPSVDDDTQAPILNGIIKHPEVLTPTDILDSMDINLVKDAVEESENAVEKQILDVKKENEETEEEAKVDPELIDVNLEGELATRAENGKVPADTSTVRNTGDDLDTLLSKINDLEGCMETKAEGAADVRKSNNDEVVEIPDDDSGDVTEISICIENKLEKETNESEEIKSKEVKSEGSTEVAAEVEEVTLKDVPDPKPASPEKMDVDDDVVCLDSPLEETDKDDDDQEMIEKALREISVSPVIEKGNTKGEEEKEISETDKKSPGENEVIEETDQTVVKAPSDKPTPMKSDEIYLIEDDDDDEPMEEAQAAQKSEKVEESDDLDLSRADELDKEIEKELEEMTKHEEEEEQQKAEVSAGDKSSSNKEEDDDDDIVCLDDSFEEVEKELTKTVEDTTKEAEKEKIVKKNEQVEKEDTVFENVSGDAEKSVTEKVDEKNLDKQPEEEVVEEVVEKIVEEEVEKLAEKVVEKDADKVIEKEDEKVVDKVSEEVVEKEAEKVAVEVSKKADVSAEAKSDSKDTPTEEIKVPTVDSAIVILVDDDDEDEGTTLASTTEKRDEKSFITDSDKKSSPSPMEEDKKVEEKSTSLEQSTTIKPSTIISDNSDNARDGVEEKEESDEAKAAQEKTPVPSESNSCSNSSSNLLKESASSEGTNDQPPAKRIRLSQDEASSRHSTLSQDDTKSNTVDDDEVMMVKPKENEDSNSLKRIHSTESIASDFKKPKTEPEVVKKTVEVKPLPLYPPPKLETPTIDLSLDFLRRFKKSVHKMTKSDLEELVLQKIVEAIVHKSEFSEMRELIEKQEKIISGHRTKITELSKQFRDLEMVHNRVLKDLETKNAQFVMPVKITRAVGLQVFFPSKKCDQPLQYSSMHMPSTPISRSTNSLNSSTQSVSSNSTATSSPSVKVPTPTSSSQATAINNAQPQGAVQRRGCVQKLTPMRPDTPRNSPLNRSVSQGAVTSSTPSPVVAKDAASSVKILNRTLPQKTRLSGPLPPGNVAVPSTPSPVAVHTAEKPKTMIAPLGIATKKTASKVFMEQSSKRKPKPCQSDPQTVAQPLPAAATVVQPQIPPSSSTNPMVTPKPVTKSVIDLTDEDDVPPTTPTANSPRTPAPATVTPATPITRAAPPPAPNAMNRGPYKVSVIPQQQLQQPKPNPPKQTPPRPIAPIAPKPNGVSVSVRPANPSRYRHPAPLPNQPIHSSNPAWKLPPARPTIRISNLESGIVISWTIEDTAKDKYAESTSYQIYAYQETSGPPLVESWRHVGDVKAMLLPMAVTLTQFQEGQRYYFAVRAVDAHNRCGPFSFAKTWS